MITEAMKSNRKGGSGSSGVNEIWSIKKNKKNISLQVKEDFGQNSSNAV